MEAHAVATGMDRILGWERVWGALIDASAKFHAAVEAYKTTPWRTEGGTGNQRKAAWNKVKGAKLTVAKAHRAAIRWCEQNNEHIPDWLHNRYGFE